MGIKVFGPFNSGTAAGSAGSATANQTTTAPLCGEVVAVYVRYNDSPPAGTTDVTVATAGNAAPPLTLLTLTDGATDGYRYPRAQVQDLTGAGVTYDGTNEVYEPVPIADNVKVTIAGANAGDSVDVWLYLRC